MTLAGQPECPYNRGVHIAKPIRHIVAAGLGGACAVAVFVWLQPRWGNWALATIPFVGFFSWMILGDVLINSLDLWLRRRTRDPIWLMGNEGKRWLESEEGHAWQRSRQSR